MSFQSTVDPGSSYDVSAADPYCVGHRIDEEPILIGMVSLALAAQGLLVQAPENPLRLRRVVWERAVMPGRGDGRLVATRRGDDLGIDLVPMSPAAARVRAFACACEAIDGNSETPPVALEPRLVEMLLRAGDATALYARLQRNGMVHDPALRVIDRVHVDGDAVVFSAATRPLAREHGLHVSPVLMHAAVCALLSLHAFDDDAAMPVSVASVDVLRPLQGHAVGILRVVRRTDETLVADVQLYDRHGALAVRLHHLTACRMRRGATPAVEASTPIASSGPVAAPGVGLDTLRRHIAALLSVDDPASLNASATFLGLGLTSVQLLDLVAHVERDLHVELYPTVFFEYQTLAEAAAFLSTLEPVDAAPPPPAPSIAQPEVPAPPPQQRVAPAVAANPPPELDDRIAVIGLGCRFARSDSPAQFWAHVARSTDLVGEVPVQRWDAGQWFDAAAGEAGSDKTYCRWGSFVDDVDRFDAGFFEVSPTEARGMDPQLRLLLEVAYHAIEDAGQARRYRGSRTGVYVGACFSEYADEMVRLHKPVGSYDLTGTAGSFLSNRVSYSFDLRGPSMTVDVACSSSLVALHLACQALRAGEADTALVAGTNLLLSPLHYLHFSALQALSPTGRCHSFDARADGYVPGEGVAALLIKPLSRALADGDRIHAVIGGSAVNHCGRSNSPTAPSVNQQAALLRSAWDAAGIDPRTIGYIEAHGTGTRLGDPIEIAAINKAFGEAASGRDAPCYVGSVKSNIGHTEGTAGLAGVIKAIGLLRDGVIPKMANFESANPLLPLDGGALRINAHATPWPATAGHPRRAGVSSFGMGGGYAHVVLEQAPVRAERALHEEARRIHVFPLSATSPEGLALQAQALADWLGPRGAIAPAALASMLQHDKEPLASRAAFVASDLRELLALLGPAQADLAAGAVLVSPACANDASARALATDWVGGQGGAWPPRLGTSDVLPYRFDRQPFWFPLPDAAVPRAASAPAGLLGRERALRLRFDGPLLTAAQPWLAQHRLRGRCIVPGVVHLEIFVQAALRAGAALPLALGNVYWLSPLGEDMACHVELEQADDGTGASLALLADGARQAAVAELRLEVPPRPAPVDIPTLAARLPHALAGAHVYDEVRATGAELGPYFHTIESIVGDRHECLATLAATSADRGEHVLAPCIVDGINHCLRGLVDDGERLGLVVPYHLARIACYAPSAGARYLHARRGATAQAFDVRLLDESGRVLVALDGFHPRAFEPAVRPASIAAAPPVAAAAAAIASGTRLDATTTRLEDLMAEVTGLAVDRIRGARDLSGLGVDSVAVAQFTRKVNRCFQVDVAPAAWFDHKSLASYAAFLCGEHAQAVARVVDGVDGGAAAAPPSMVAAASPAAATGRLEIAVIGIAGRFPRSADVDALWTNLAAGRDLVGEIPAQRFDWREFAAIDATMPRHGAFMDDVDQFAAAFFGVSRREAELMDPQQRLFLEASRELLVDAAYTRDALRGADVGVFVGVVNNEYYELLNEHGVEIEPHTSTGMARCVLANRVSHFFDFSGPSEVIDTACSSSLVAVHRAVQSIRSGECSMAIAGGVNVLLTPKLFVSFGKAGMLAPDGRCKTFDARANGYVRGEGCGAVLLKPLDRALADGDPIYGLVRGSGVNHGGHVQSLTVPNPQAQSALVAQVLYSAGVEPGALSYVEAHGTGTPLGDPIEFNALKRVFANVDGATARCGVGSIKSNLGHLEGAAGIAGLLKTLLALHHRELPASLHVQALNPQIRLDDSPLYVVDRHQPWHATNGERLAGVSSFGFGGVNAHVLLSGFEAPRASGSGAWAQGCPILLSADDDEALRLTASRLHRYLCDPHSRFAALAQACDESALLGDVAYTLMIGRDALAVRTGFVARSVAELIDQLADRGRGLGPVVRADGRPANVDEFAACMSRRDSSGVLSTWLAGRTLPWAALASRGVDVAAGARRVPLPGVPLARERYWFQASTTASAPAPAPAKSPRPEPTALIHPFF